MRGVVSRFAAIGVIAGFLCGFHGITSQTPPLTTRIADFVLPQASDGRQWSLAAEGRGAKAVVVLFLGTECPVSNMYLPTLTNMQLAYGPKGALFVGIFSNQQDDAPAVARHAYNRELICPVLKDTGATVADRFQVKRVPEVFVLDGNRTVRYRGRIDDQFGKGIKRAQPTSHDLRDALEAVLAGKAVARPVTEAIGCPLSRPVPQKKVAVPQGAVITYSKHVAPLLQNHCQECHRPGEIGPFQMMTYEDALTWSAAIREVVAERRMPPWFADPAHGKFVNDSRLSDADRATLLAWVDQGCAEGNPADAPAPRTYVQGWGIGTPDLVLAMNQEFKVPAQAPKGGIPYKYILAGRPFTEEKWVEAVEVRPGNRALVHHINVFMVPPGQQSAPAGDVIPVKLSILQPGRFKLPPGDVVPDGLGKKMFNDVGLFAAEAPEVLGVFVPGMQVGMSSPYPPGLARRIPKGSQLVFEVHYVPNGKPGVDRSTIGLVYSKQPPKHEVREGSISNWRFAIPPQAADHVVKATSMAFDKDTVLLELNPHMHLRGKSFAFHLVLPDGKREVLLSIPRYDFNWQLTYILDEPKRLPKGSKIECVAHFDNSAGNPNNPDPSQRVVWGDQTWEEMMTGYYEYYEPEEKLRK